MIELYTWTTPNGEKPVIMLEELGLDYALRLIDISTGKQKESDFLAINPNGRIPALTDDGVRVFESGAILLHLAEKTGRLIAQSGVARAEALGWVFFQAGGTGPMIGQVHYFRNASERSDFAIRRFEKEAERLLGVLDARLTEAEYLAGDYSVADVMNVSWARAGLKALDAHERFPALAAWVRRVDARPAVVRALEKLKAAKDALAS
ncbi:glutathione S-transferase family protein [Aureimonas sp. SK2]|uniref:glutathione S-transferase family protein n=1 Tax=Aureimonas sp. SK2 TaxID=3015992 RepID=UPI00244474C7|nr:glutathione S-transferase N-terminal domain-containing protein [Aureimonas sp. SK2]